MEQALHALAPIRAERLGEHWAELFARRRFSFQKIQKKGKYGFRENQAQPLRFEKINRSGMQQRAPGPRTGTLDGKVAPLHSPIAVSPDSAVSIKVAWPGAAN